MSVTRLLVPGVRIAPGQVCVPTPAAHHARVARVAVGEAVELLDLEGTVGVGTVTRWAGGSCWVGVERVEHERGEPPAPLVLGLGVLHTRAFDWAVEKATELGATEIVPVICTRVQGGRHGDRVERWQRLANAAVAQCGRSRPPVVAQPQRLSDFLARSRGRCLVARAGASVPESFRPDSEGMTLFVGPEGGLTDEEVAGVSAAGFAGLPLGPRTLRAETAAVAVLTLAQRLAGWLD
jgi:16S rRNA (uracil1498-N3)-methyltransferase